MIAPEVRPGLVTAPRGEVNGLLQALASAGFPDATGRSFDLSGEGGSGAREEYRAVLDWARSGGMWLTGWPDGPPCSPAGPVMARLRAAAEVASLMAGSATGERIDVPVLIGGRSALGGRHRSGRTSVGGSCRMVACRDGWVAVNLARLDDIWGAGAVLGRDITSEPWSILAQEAAGFCRAHLVARLQELGVAAALVTISQHELARSRTRLGAPTGSDFVPDRDEPAGQTLPWRVTSIRPDRPHWHGRSRGDTRPWVIDLSAMWAGPTCAQILGWSGMRVTKIESQSRPDGARFANTGFFDWLHQGHESVVLDFETVSGRRALQRLVMAGDVVIESSRPRALQQLGIDAREMLEEDPAKTWISITGYGRQGDDARRVGFGDDAAAAGGLVALDGSGDPIFCGDAMADPVSGLYAAVAGLASRREGGGHLIDLAMSAAAAYVAAPGSGPPLGYEVQLAANGNWIVRQGDASDAVRSPMPPPRVEPARPSGADTATVLHQLGLAG